MACPAKFQRRIAATVGRVNDLIKHDLTKSEVIAIPITVVVLVLVFQVLSQEPDRHFGHGEAVFPLM